MRVSEAGRVRGLQAPRRKTLQLSPYVLTWALEAKYTDVGEGFNPEVGILLESGGFRRPEALVSRPRKPGLLGLFAPAPTFLPRLRARTVSRDGLPPHRQPLEWPKYELHTA
jgi:hypothetical protein